MATEKAEAEKKPAARRNPNKSFQASTEFGAENRAWWVVDATDKPLGRLASEVAARLRGKHKPTYTPHVDTGEYVVVVNCEKVVFTGRKWDKKEYTYYTGYTNLRRETARERLENKPEEVLIEAVRRMLPKNKLAVRMLEKLKVYAGPNHPHQAQDPQPKDLGV